MQRASGESERERKGLAQLALHTDRVADTEQAALLRRAAGRKRLDHHQPPAAVSIELHRKGARRGRHRAQDRDGKSKKIRKSAAHAVQATCTPAPPRVRSHPKAHILLIGGSPEPLASHLRCQRKYCREGGHYRRAIGSPLRCPTKPERARPQAGPAHGRHQRGGQRGAGAGRMLREDFLNISPAVTPTSDELDGSQGERHFTPSPTEAEAGRRREENIKTLARKREELDKKRLKLQEQNALREQQQVWPLVEPGDESPEDPDADEFWTPQKNPPPPSKPSCIPQLGLGEVSRGEENNNTNLSPAPPPRAPTKPHIPTLNMALAVSHSPKTPRDGAGGVGAKITTPRGNSSTAHVTQLNMLHGGARELTGTPRGGMTPRRNGYESPHEPRSHATASPAGKTPRSARGTPKTWQTVKTTFVDDDGGLSSTPSKPPIAKRQIIAKYTPPKVGPLSPRIGGILSPKGNNKGTPRAAAVR